MPKTIANTRFETPGGVPYTLVAGYPKFTFNQNAQATATEVYLIDPRNLDALLADVTPIPTYAPDGSIVFWPVYFLPGTTFLAFDSMTCEPQSSDLPVDPFGADPGAPAGTYDQILQCTIQYKTLAAQKPDQQQPETFLERSMSGTTEMLIIQPSPTLKIINEVDGSEEAIKNPATAPTVKMIPLIEHSYSWKKAINPNFLKMFSVLGCCNESEYPFLLNAPVESTLFLGWTAKQEFQYVGNNTIISPWNIDLKFVSKIVNDDTLGPNKQYFWNHVYNPDTQLWQRLKRKTRGAGNRDLYEKKDFNIIFQR